jgi:hypothetical protein
VDDADDAHNDLTRPASEREAALYLVSLGLNDCQISRYMNVPYRTIQGWRRPTYIPKHPDVTRQDCPRCNGISLNEPKYAYLLGMYLGDGVLVAIHRGVFRLEIALDSRYPAIIEECKVAMAGLRSPHVMTVGSRTYTSWCVVYGHWKHWPCLFPQHGSGKKHNRKIQLAPWQQEIVGKYPELLLRGLIHSDGWRGTNRVRNRTGRVYAYARYIFTNNSLGIRSIFCEACEAYGIRWAASNWNRIAISRKADVAKLDEVIGPKS